MESGHTPSRKHSEYWGGDVPWISLPDAKANHGRTITDTAEHTNALGVANSSTRVLPTGTVCLSRTASVGYVTVMGRAMATSQDFVNWVCSDRLDPDFLKYVFLAEGRDGLLRFASGAVHQTVYFPEAKAFHICHPSVDEQRRLVGVLGEALEGIAAARTNAERNLRNARALLESYIQSALCNPGINWRTAPLGELCDVLDSRRKPVTKRDRVPGDVPYYGATGVQDYVADHLFDEPLVLVGEDGAKWGPGDRTAFCIDGKSWVNNHAHALRPRRARLLDSWLVYFLNATDLSTFIGGLTVPKLNQGSLRGIPIPVPPVSEQEVIIASLDLIERSVQQLTQIYNAKLTALDELKQSLLYHAFTGQLTERTAAALGA